MIFEALEAFAGPAPEPDDIQDTHNAPARRDKPLGRQFLDHRIYGRPLHAEQAGKRLLRELDPIPRPRLDVKQPARGSLGDRMEGVAGARLHDP